nr:hypothetical protein [Senegalimassilia anaerobia]
MSGARKTSFFVAEHFGHDARLGGLVLENGEVELAILELLDELGLVAGVQVHPGLGTLAHVERDEPGKEGHPVGIAHSHGDVGREMLVDGGDLRGHDPFHVGHVLSELHGHLSRLRKRDTRGGPIDERGTELLLDGGDFLRQPGARHVQLTRRLGEALRLREDEQNFDIVEHHEPSSSAVAFHIVRHKSGSSPCSAGFCPFVYRLNPPEGRPSRAFAQ